MGLAILVKRVRIRPELSRHDVLVVADSRKGPTRASAPVMGVLARLLITFLTTKCMDFNCRYRDSAPEREAPISPFAGPAFLLPQSTAANHH